MSPSYTGQHCVVPQGTSRPIGWLSCLSLDTECPPFELWSGKGLETRCELVCLSPRISRPLVKMANLLTEGRKASLGRATLPFEPGCPEVCMPQGPPSAFELLHFKEDFMLRAECPIPPRPQAPWGPKPSGWREARASIDQGLILVLRLCMAAKSSSIYLSKPSSCCWTASSPHFHP